MFDRAIFMPYFNTTAKKVNTNINLTAAYIN
jgi:hypothetical protein